MGLDSVSGLARTIPEMLFCAYQMTFAIITCALVGGATAERMKFSAFCLFCALWLFLVYIPSAHWVWGGGFLAEWGLIDFAGGTVVHINAGVAGLVAALTLGSRHGLSAAKISRRSTCRWPLLASDCSGSAGSDSMAARPSGSDPRAVYAIVATHFSACAGALVWSGLEWLHNGTPVGSGPDFRRRGRPGNHHPGVRLRAALARACSSGRSPAASASGPRPP